MGALGPDPAGEDLEPREVGMEGKHGRSWGSGTTLGARNERGGLQGPHTVMGTWGVEVVDERSWRMPASRAERDESEEQHRKTHTDTGHWAAGRQKRPRGAANGGGWPALKPRWAPSHTTYLLRPGTTTPGRGCRDGNERCGRAARRHRCLPQGPLCLTGTGAFCWHSAFWRSHSLP